MCAWHRLPRELGSISRLSPSGPVPMPSGSNPAPSASGSWARCLRCSRTGEAAPLDRPAGLSPAGAPWLVEYDLDPERGAALRAALPGRRWSLWRYRVLLQVVVLDVQVGLGGVGTALFRLVRVR